MINSLRYSWIPYKSNKTRRIPSNWTFFHYLSRDEISFEVYCTPFLVDCSCTVYIYECCLYRKLVDERFTHTAKCLLTVWMFAIILSYLLGETSLRHLYGLRYWKLTYTSSLLRDIVGKRCLLVLCLSDREGYTSFL